MATFKAVVLKGDIHTRKDGKTNIKIRLTHSGGVAYISTDLYIVKDYFANGWATKGKDKAFINGRIVNELQYYQGEFLKIDREAKGMVAGDLKKRLMIKEDREKIDFYKFAEIVLDKSTEGTLRWHKSTISNLRKFAPDLYMHNITLRFLNDFETFLRSNGANAGINNYMRSLRSIFNQAREFYNDEESGMIRIPQYPFSKYQIPKPEKKKSIGNRLTIDELRMFIYYKPETDREQLAKDMSLLMFYLIGINAKDLYFLSKPDNSNRIKFDRFKTGREYSIRLEPEATEIIKKYKGNTRLINASEKYATHLSFIKAINIGLHGYEIINQKTKKVSKALGIFQKLGIEKRVTSNWFRHTWASIARNECRINKDDVALCLGHEDKDNKVTDDYIFYDYSIIDESNRQVIDEVFARI